MENQEPEVVFSLSRIGDSQINYSSEENKYFRNPARYDERQAKLVDRALYGDGLYFDKNRSLKPSSFPYSDDKIESPGRKITIKLTIGKEVSWLKLKQAFDKTEELYFFCQQGHEEKLIEIMNIVLGTNYDASFFKAKALADLLYKGIDEESAQTLLNHVKEALAPIPRGSFDTILAFVRNNASILNQKGKRYTIILDKLLKAFGEKDHSSR